MQFAGTRTNTLAVVWWKQALAFYADVMPGATIYFFIFWRRFEYWRRHRTLSLAVVASTFGLLAVALLVAHDLTFAGKIDFPVAVEVVGWLLVIAASTLGTVADRQIGFRVRSFTPFFQREGHLRLITNGAYGVVRHPIYGAGIGFQVGTFLVTGFPSVMLATMVFGGGAVWFTKQEEMRLTTLLDDPTEYERYRASVPALIPRLVPRRMATRRT